MDPNSYYARNREKKAVYHKERIQKLKGIVYNHYGWRCVCCGTTTPEFLTLDHIHGGGYQHRKKSSVGGGTNFYRWVINNNFPDTIQVLCMNCNFGRAKRADKICPHKFIET